VIFFPIAFFSLAATTLHGDPKNPQPYGDLQKNEKGLFLPRNCSHRRKRAETGHEQPK